MKQSLIRSLSAGLGLAALAGLSVGIGGTAAQEADRVVVAPRGQAISILGGSGGFLGVTIADVDDERASEAGLSRAYGVYIASVMEDGPAADGGVEEGDVIVAWNGDRIESAAQLRRLASETPSGRVVELTVLRDGGERDLSVELGDRSDARALTLPGGNFQLRTAPRGRIAPSPRVMVRPDADARSFLFSSRPRLGASIQSLGDQLAEYFGVDGGALVTSVSEDSPAEAGGLRAGDVIIGIAGEDVGDPGDLLEALSDLDAGEVSLRIVRDGAERTLTVELEEPDEERRWRDRDGDVRLFWNEGDDVSVEPFTMEGFDLGPIEFEGFEMEPVEWDFDLGGWFDGEPIHIQIPSIDVPGFEIPAIEMPDIDLPGFRMRVPRVVVRV